MTHKKLVVLDIDETLVHTTNNPLLEIKVNSGMCPITECYDFTFMIDKHRYWGKKRPHFDTFIKYIHTNFEIGIWSAGSEDYVVNVLMNTFPNDILQDILFVYTFASCQILQIESEMYIIKDLNRLWGLGNVIDEFRPYNNTNTIVVDDNPYTYSQNKDNAIGVNAWRFTMENALLDYDLLRVQSIISHIKNSNDVKEHLNK